MEVPAHEIWALVADVRNTGRFSAETFDAEWLDGVTEPAVGARFRGHVKRNEIGPVYWTTCRVTACEPGREFGFAVLLGSRAVNNWHYRFTPNGGGTDVTESFQIPVPAFCGPRRSWGFCGSGGTCAICARHSSASKMLSRLDSGSDQRNPLKEFRRSAGIIPEIPARS